MLRFRNVQRRTAVSIGEMLVNDKISEFYAKLTEDNDSVGEDLAKRERLTRETIETLRIFTNAFTQGADSFAQRLIVFELDSALLPLLPASAVPSRDVQAYRIRLSVRLIDALVKEMAGVTAIGDERYRPEAVILLAAFAAIAHELAHVAYGHLDRPLDPETKDPKVVRAYESDADRRAGATMIAMYFTDSTRSIISKFGAVESIGDFIEASCLAIVMICLFFQKGHNRRNPSEHYHSPSTRRLLLQDGLAAGLGDHMKDGRLLTAAGVMKANKVVQQLNIASGKELRKLLQGDAADLDLYRNTTLPLVRGIVRELADASPFSLEK